MHLKNYLLFLLSFLIGLSLFIWVIKFVTWTEIRSVFLIFTGWEGMVIIALTFLEMLLGNWRWKEILKNEGVQISFSESLKISLAGFSLTYLTPMLIGSGELLRSYILKTKKQITFAKAIASVIIDRIFEWTDNLVVVFLGMVFFLYKINLPPRNSLLIFSGGFLLFTLGMSFFYFKALRRESMAKTLGKVFNHRLDEKPLEVENEIFHFFKPPRKTMWQCIGYAFLGSFIVYLKFMFLMMFLGKEIQILPILSILGFDYLVTMFPIPTALGSREAVQTFVFESLHLGASTAFVFTNIIRGGELVLALVGLVFFLRSGISLFQDNFNNEK